ncbi:unnamed protein product [Spirodela intermedia]|uniref:DNA mismatch repair protein n=1 Tax=Spirodela intermedia TaxID=51605 RepID=A0A7I8JYA5_SPIIN|nr:unnamed protein product [Spirodela intermedia]
MAPSRRHSNGRSPLVRKQSQITAFFSPGKSPGEVPSVSSTRNAASCSPKDCSPEGVLSLNPNPNPEPDPDLTLPSSKRKKPLLVVGHTPDSSLKAANPRLGEEVIGRRLRVFWPLDKTWYEGQVKSFDREAGKHVVQYADAEEEVLDLGAERIEWVEESARSFRRLRRRTSVSESLLPDTVSTGDTNTGEDVTEGSQTGEDTTEDEDWNEGSGEEIDKGSDEMKLEEENSDGGEEHPKTRRGKNSASKKRKTGEADKVDPAKKERSDVNSKKLLSTFPVGRNELHNTDKLLSSDAIERFGKRETEKFRFLGEGRKDANKRRPGDASYDPKTLYLPPEFLKSLTGGQRQWWEFKAKHMDKVLFFKMGKFYELFEMDAHIGAKDLELQYMKGEQPHCGFPEKNFSTNLEKLVRKGYRVLVVEQTETPEQLELRRKEMGSKDKVVKREICAVVSKGTLAEGELLSRHADASYLLSLTEKSATLEDRERTVLGVCVVDVCTSTFMLGQFEDDSERQCLCSMLSELRPVEIIKPSKVLGPQTERALQRHTRCPLVNELVPSVEFWDSLKTVKEIQNMYQQCGHPPVSGSLDNDASDDAVNESSSFPDVLSDFMNAGENGSYALSAFGGCLFYLRQCLLDESLIKCAKFESLPYSGVINMIQRPYMILNASALENLEILENKNGGFSGTLLAQLDHCATASGKRLLKSWLARPLYDTKSIVERQDAVAYFKGAALGSALEFRKDLAKLPDMERLLARLFSTCEANGRNANKVILYEDASRKQLQEFVACLRGCEVMAKACSSLGSILEETKSNLLLYLLTPGKDLPDVHSVINQFKDAFDWAEADQSGRIVPHQGVDADYDSACRTISDIESSLARYLKEQRKALGDASITYATVGKELYLLQVPEDLGGRIPRDYELRSSKKGYFRYWTTKIKMWLAELSQAEAEKESKLKSILQVLIKRFSGYHRLWRQLVSATAELDVLICLAIASDHYDGPTCRPTIKPTSPSSDSVPPLFARSLGHPILRSDASGTASFVPNDVRIGGDGHPSFILLTGPNMGGKSTLLRQICLASVLAQLGADVPAERFELSPVDRIFVRMGARDHIISGRSTFLTELTETASMLSSATRNSLVVLDELGRGTSTSDGQAIADSVLEYFVRSVRCRGLFSTHYHRLAVAYEDNPEVSLCHMSCHVGKGAGGIEEVTFLYKLKPGLCPKSYGVNVARLAGLPGSVLEKAAEKSREFEVTYGKGKGGGKGSLAVLRDFVRLSVRDPVASNLRLLIELQQKAGSLVEAS